MFCNVCLVKKHKIAINYTATEAREKRAHIFRFLGISEIFHACLTKLKKLLNLIIYSDNQAIYWVKH